MFLSILLDVIAPIMLLIGLGAWMRWKFRIDIGTLSKLNIYFLVPGFIFHAVSTSTLPWSDMGGIVAATAIQCVTLGLIVLAIGKVFNVSRPTLSAIALAVMFYNSGNYGLPLAQLAYPQKMVEATGKDAAAVQAFVLMTMNLLNFTLGTFIATSATAGSVWQTIKRIFRLPMLPALGAGLLCKWWLSMGHQIPVFIEKPTGYIADALVPMALATLGAQLASRPRWPRWKPVAATVLLRLGFGPLQMAAILYLLHLTGYPPVDLWGNKGWPAELLIITAAVPTAVNTLLLTLECEGDADLAADCVFWTTLLSCVTIPLWIYGIWLFFGTTGVA